MSHDRVLDAENISAEYHKQYDSMLDVVGVKVPVDCIRTVLGALDDMLDAYNDIAALVDDDKREGHDDLGLDMDDYDYDPIHSVTDDYIWLGDSDHEHDDRIL